MADESARVRKLAMLREKSEATEKGPRSTDEDADEERLRLANKAVYALLDQCDLEREWSDRLVREIVEAIPGCLPDPEHLDLGDQDTDPIEVLRWLRGAITTICSERNTALAERDEAESRADAALAEVERLREGDPYKEWTVLYAPGWPGGYTVTPNTREKAIEFAKENGGRVFWRWTSASVEIDPSSPEESGTEPTRASRPTSEGSEE